MARYRVPPRTAFRLGLAMVGAAATDLAGDAEDLVAAIDPPPLLEGEELIPRDGTFCAVANHCERRGLWIGFPSAVLVGAVARRRPGSPPLHFAVAGQTRLLEGRLPVPGTGWLYRRVARCYGMVPLPPGPRALGERAAALRALARLALPPPAGRGEPVALYPEGERGTSSCLGEALPGSGELLLILSRGGVPLLPAGFSEAGGRLVCRIGEPFRLEGGTAGRDRPSRDLAARHQVMERIAGLLDVPPAPTPTGRGR